jgi:hypothetical protein
MNSVNRIAAKMAPTIETQNAAAMARPALPCFAMGRPSNITATDQGLPGTAKRIEVTTPPNIEPQ